MAKPADMIPEIEALFSVNLHIKPESADEDLFQAGILDSLTLVRLIPFLEQRFRCSLPIEDLEVEDFRTLTRIAELISREASLGGQPL